MAGLVAYTPLKRRWWAGPIANAWIVALLVVMGWLVGAGNTEAGRGGLPQIIPVALMTLASYANFVLVGYLKDIRADSETNYNTFPVVYGWRRTALVSHAWAAAALGGALWALWGIDAEGRITTLAAGALLAGATVVSIAAQTALHRTTREEDAHRPIANVVRVFLLIHAAVIVRATPTWGVAAGVLVVAFEVLLRLRPERRQV